MASPPGIMVHSRFQAKGEAQQTGLFIREESARIRQLGTSPVVEIRAGLLQEGEIYLLAIMARIGGEIYETWLNYNQEDGGDCLSGLAAQKRLLVAFYGDQGRERAITINNSNLAIMMGEAIPILAGSRRWGMADFDEAKARVCNRYPASVVLWEALGAWQEGGKDGCHSTR